MITARELVSIFCYLDEAEMDLPLVIFNRYLELDSVSIQNLHGKNADSVVLNSNESDTLYSQKFTKKKIWQKPEEHYVIRKNGQKIGSVEPSIASLAFWFAENCETEILKAFSALGYDVNSEIKDLYSKGEQK